MNSIDNTTNNNDWRTKIILFLSAQTCSLLGSSIVQYAIIWYVVLKTSSGIMLTISTICGFLPQIIISIFAGAWLDRYNRKNLMMLSDAIIAFATLILAISFITGHENIYLLFLVLSIRSLGSGIQTPAVNSIIAQIVPKDNLIRINAINSTINSLMMFLSPAISGAILSISTIETTLFIDVITAIIGISITYTINIPKYIKNKINISHIEEIKQGLCYLKENKFIRNMLFFIITIAILVSPSAFLTPLMIKRVFGNEIWRFTVSEMTFSAGATLGGILMAIFGVFKNRMFTTIFACIFYGLMMICLGISPSFINFSLTIAFLIYLIFNFLIGVTIPWYNSPITATIQDKVPSSMHGRIFSFMQIANSSALPLGMIIFGPLADIFSVQTLLIFNGGIVIICGFFTWKNKFFTF